MRVLVSGASGLVGSALIRRLPAPNEAVRLVRGEPAPGLKHVHWDPDAGTVDADGLEDLDAVVHLAGENLASGRWTEAKKACIRNSRVRGTSLLAQALAGLARPPKVLVSASAVGYYGNRGSDALDETSEPGAGFLADVCRAWEAATQPASAAGIRVVHARLGVVLDRQGGVLARLLPLFRLGLGGRLGSGRQYLSWITLDDAARAIMSILERDSLQGPVNVTSPRPVTNREFTAVLGRVLHRPTLFLAPALMLRLALGEMADEMLLSGARVMPRKLESSGFVFSDPDLERAVRRIVG